MIEGIAVIRDIVIILSAIIITYVVVVVGGAVLDLTRKTENLRSFVVTAVTGVLNPIKGLLLTLSRAAQRKR